MSRKMMESKRERKESTNSNETIIVNTPKLVIKKGKQGIHAEASHSKAAPQYLKNLIDTGEIDQDEDENDPSTSTLTPGDSFDSSCSKSYDLLEEWKKKVQQDERLSRIYQLRHSFSLRFDNRAWLHPHGTTNFDYKGIPEDKKERFEKFKNRVRQENYEYLRNHPEIQGIISLALKKLLQAEPEDPVKYLTEYFTSTKKGSNKEFEKNVKVETEKISIYHLKKMSNAGRINFKPCTEVRSEASGEDFRPEGDANYLKKLGIGALAKDFCFIDNCLKEKKKESEDSKPIKKSKKKPRKYCGCKDWKLKKNRMSAEKEAEEMDNTPTITVSTLENVKDELLLTSVPEDEGDEEEMNFGDGQFYGEMSGEAEEITPEEAQRIANEMVQEMFT